MENISAEKRFTFCSRNTYSVAIDERSFRIRGWKWGCARSDVLTFPKASSYHPSVISSSEIEVNRKLRNTSSESHALRLIWLIKMYKKPRNGTVPWLFFEFSSEGGRIMEFWDFDLKKHLKNGSRFLIFQTLLFKGWTTFRNKYVTSNLDTSDK